MLDYTGFTLDEYADHHGIPRPATLRERMLFGRHLAKRGYTCRTAKREGISVRLWSKHDPSSLPAILEKLP